MKILIRPPAPMRCLHALRPPWSPSDPLWRWATGRTAPRRRQAYWRIAAWGLGLALLGLIALVYLGPLFRAPSGMSVPFLQEKPARTWLVIYLHAGLLLAIAISPFPTFERMGGAAMLEELSMTRLTSRETARLIYWGSFRRAVVPALGLYWAALALHLAGGLDGAPALLGSPHPGSTSPRPLMASLLARAVFFAPLEFAAIHSLGWILLLRNGIRRPFFMQSLQFVIALGLAAGALLDHALQALGWAVLLIYWLVSAAGAALISAPVRAAQGLRPILSVVAALVAGAFAAFLSAMGAAFLFKSGRGEWAVLGVLAVAAVVFYGVLIRRWDEWFRRARGIDPPDAPDTGQGRGG